MMTVMIHSDAHLNEISSASVIHTIVIDMRDYFSKSIHNTFIYTASAIMHWRIEGGGQGGLAPPP